VKIAVIKLVNEQPDVFQFPARPCGRGIYIWEEENEGTAESTTNLAARAAA